MSDDIPPGTKVGPPATFGWLRRADLELTNGCAQIWERPNGILVIFEGDRCPVIMQRPPLKPPGKVDHDD